MRALLSVSDKAGIVEFAKGLEAQGWDIISTGVNIEIYVEEYSEEIKRLENGN